MGQGALIFDLGGVVVDWDPRHLYAKLFDNPERREWFLDHVCPMEWHREFDRGASMTAAIERRCVEFPEWTPYIRAYFDHWREMFAGTIPGAVELLGELAAAGTPLFAITNWPAETFPFALVDFPVLRLFADIVVSGRVKLIKPDPAIFELALEAFGVDRRSSLFIDDSAANVAGALAVGLPAVRFVDVPTLRAHPCVGRHLR
jgi:2-haloacid dehalogenase